MIVKKQAKMGFFKLLIEMKGSIVPAILPKILLSALLGLIVTLIIEFDIFGKDTRKHVSIELGPFAGVGVAISLLLGFHNNASYGRWWEARTYWGNQVIAVRDLTRFLVGVMDVGCVNGGNYYSKDKTSHIDIGIDKEVTPNVEITQELVTLNSVTNSTDIEMDMDVNEYQERSTTTTSNSTSNSISSVNYNIDAHSNPKTNTYASWQVHIIHLAIAQTHAFRYQMRPSCKMDGVITAKDDRDRFLNTNELNQIRLSKNAANTLMLLASKTLGKAHRSKQIDTYSMIHVQEILNTMCKIQTACERIQNTSLPIAYSMLVHRTTVLYVILVPFAFVPSQGWWTPLFTAIVAYTFFGLDELAKEIQEPMIDRPMCLALSAMCRTIEIDALEAIYGVEYDTPEYLKPVHNILM